MGDGARGPVPTRRAFYWGFDDPTTVRARFEFTSNAVKNPGDNRESLVKASKPTGAGVANRCVCHVAPRLLEVAQMYADIGALAGVL